MKIFMKIPRDYFKIIKKEHNKQEKEIKENIKKEVENNPFFTSEKELFEDKARNTELILKGTHKKVFLLSERERKDILREYFNKNLSYINTPKKFEKRKIRFDKFFTIINDFNQSPPLSRDRLGLFLKNILELELPPEYWGRIGHYLTKETLDKSKETELTQEEIEKERNLKREKIENDKLKKFERNAKIWKEQKRRKASTKAIQELDKQAHLQVLRLFDNFT